MDILVHPVVYQFTSVYLYCYSELHNDVRGKKYAMFQILSTNLSSLHFLISYSHLTL